MTLTQDPDAQTPLLQSMLQTPLLDQPATTSSKDKDETETPVPSSLDKEEIETPQYHAMPAESPVTGEKSVESSAIPKFMTPVPFQSPFQSADSSDCMKELKKQERKAKYGEREKAAQAMRDAMQKDEQLRNDFEAAKVAGKDVLKKFKDDWNSSRASRSQYKHVWPIGHIAKWKTHPPRGPRRDPPGKISQARFPRQGVLGLITLSGRLSWYCIDIGIWLVLG